jgi:hypothetical protein
MLISTEMKSSGGYWDKAVSFLCGGVCEKNEKKALVLGNETKIGIRNVILVYIGAA